MKQSFGRRTGWTWVFALIGGVMAEKGAVAESLPGFDFTKAETVAEWQPTHDVARLEVTAEGMLIEISGHDPYIHGPVRDYPPNQPLWMRLRLKSEQAGTGQVFYFTQGASEPNSVRFPVRAGTWEDIRVPMPTLGPGFRLRFDPPGTSGKAILASIRFESRLIPKEPEWPMPTAVTFDKDALKVSSGDLQITHAQDQLGGFALGVAGARMAVGFNRFLIGYAQANGVRWFALPEHAQVKAKLEEDAIVVQANATDSDGATWEVVQQFTASEKPGVIVVETRVTVSQERYVLFLPMFAVLPGVGSFGETKGQGVFAGLEYLDNEPSSSEADITGPGAKRQVPNGLKITFPLTAIQANQRYVGLLWEQGQDFAAFFDSPDRLFKSGGHVMGVLFPGSDGRNRQEGSLLPNDVQRLEAGKTLSLRATLIGGKGKSIVPAVEQYVAFRGLPPVPDVGMDFQGYVNQASAGWLDSKLREGNQYRHAYWPGSSFGPQPPADAALWMDWLALQTQNETLERRLKDAAKEALTQVQPADYNASGVSHVRYPVQSLVYGHVAENANRALQTGRELLKRFEPDGSVLYRKEPNRPDLGKTHFAPDANGLTAQAVLSVLNAATFCGDEELTREGLRLLRALDKFSSTVPRGAQTWEVPLHTPDILASAHLLRAYTIGYELTGEAHFFEQARYWAWTGVPFVYVVNPTPHPVGPYATIPVLGATHWSHSWLGLPVQWCGLVYSDALYRFIRHDPKGPWKQIADGITASGAQQNWPVGDAALQGLLPDSFNPGAQTRNGVAINPGTVQANAVRLFNRPEVYDFRVFRKAGLWIHAPGALTSLQEQAGRISFSVQSWAEQPYYVLVLGCRSTPSVRVGKQEVSLAGPNQFLEKERRLLLQLRGQSDVEIVLK